MVESLLSTFLAIQAPDQEQTQQARATPFPKEIIPSGFLVSLEEGQLLRGIDKMGNDT